MEIATEELKYYFFGNMQHIVFGKTICGYGDNHFLRSVHNDQIDPGPIPKLAFF